MTVEILWLGCALIGVALFLGAAVGFSRNGPLMHVGRRYVDWLDYGCKDVFAETDGRELVAAQALGVVLAVGLAVAYDQRAALAVPLVLAAPVLYLSSARKQRRQEIEGQLNGWLLMLANMLQVTGSLTEALSHTADLTRGALGQEIDLLLKEQRVGSPLSDALRNMGARVGSPLLSSVVTIMLVGRMAGGQLPSLLEETAAAIRERARLEAVVRKQTAMGRAQLVVLFLGPPIIVYMFRRVDPAFFQPLFDNGAIGYGLAVVALVFWLASLVMARRILAVDI